MGGSALSGSMPVWYCSGVGAVVRVESKEMRRKVSLLPRPGSCGETRPRYCRLGDEDSLLASNEARRPLASTTLPVPDPTTVSSSHGGLNRPCCHVPWVIWSFLVCSLIRSFMTSEGTVAETARIRVEGLIGVGGGFAGRLGLLASSCGEATGGLS